MSDDTRSYWEWLAEHPRLLGLLFAAVLALSQAAPVAASGADTISGP